MIHNLKVLGLALMAVFALAAVGASGASAQNGEVSAAGAVNEFTLTGTETGTGTNKLESFGSFVECPGSTYTGHKYEETPHKLILDGASTATITPHYATKCFATALKFPATVTMNGCDYQFHLGPTTTGDSYSVNSALVCPGVAKPEVEIYKSGSEHKLENLKCTLTIDPKTNQKTEFYTGLVLTDTTVGDLDLTGTAEGIKVTQEEGPAKGCLSGVTTDNNGKLKVDVTVKAHDKNLANVNIGISHK